MNHNKKCTMPLKGIALAIAISLAGCVHQPSVGSGDDRPESAVAKQGDEKAPLATGMTRRVLANGLTVILYPRQSPEGGAEFRLAVRAGSLQESDEERGLAHFIEHLAFNGTRDYPGQSVFKHLEREGMKLGADVNAVTSLADTTYKLSLPEGSTTTVDDALHILSQCAFHVTFDPATFERERGIIVEEWRLREGMGARINGPLQRLRYAGSQARDRDPIGLIQVIREAPMERAKAFYKRWYSPQNMTLIVTGNFDIRAFDTALERYFATEPVSGRTTPEDWGRFDTVLSPADRVALVLDPEVSDRFVQIMCQRTLDGASDTVNELWREAIERITLRILKDRFTRLSDGDHPVRLQAPSSNWILSPSENQILLLARPRDDAPLTDAVRAVAGELKELTVNGPTADELTRAKAAALREALDNRRRAAQRSNAAWADEIADAVIYTLPLLDADQEAQLLDTFLPSMTAQHIRATAHAMLQSTVKIAAVGPADEAVTGAGLLAAWEQGSSAAPDKRPAIEERKGPDLTPPKRTAPLTTLRLRSPREGARLTAYTLENGLRVLVFSDSTLTGNTKLNLRVRGGVSAEPDGIVSVPAALTLPMQSGVGALSPADIRYSAREARVSLMSYAEALHHGIRAEAPHGSLPTMMALLTARLSSPHFDEQALEKLRRQHQRDHAHRPAERRFMDAITRASLANGNAMTVDSEDREALTDLARLKDLEGRLLGDPSRMVVTVVTQEKTETVEATVLPWLASLRQRAVGVADWTDRHIRPRQDIRNETWPWATADKTMVQMHYFHPMAWSIENRKGIEIASLAANNALRESLRTDASGVYTVMLNSQLVKDPSPYFLGRVNFTAAPERASALIRQAETTLERLGVNGIDRSEFRSLLARLNLERQSAASRTEYWCEALAQSMGDRSLLEALVADPDVSLESVNTLLRTLFMTRPSVYAMTPSSKKDTL